MEHMWRGLATSRLASCPISDHSRQSISGACSSFGCWPLWRPAWGWAPRLRSPEPRRPPAWFGGCPAPLPLTAASCRCQGSAAAAGSQLCRRLLRSAQSSPKPCWFHLAPKPSAGGAGAAGWRERGHLLPQPLPPGGPQQHWPPVPAGATGQEAALGPRQAAERLALAAQVPPRGASNWLDTCENDSGVTFRMDASDLQCWGACAINPACVVPVPSVPLQELRECLYTVSQERTTRW